MLGDKIGEEVGKVTVQRALASAGGGPRMEITFQAGGSILGVNHRTTGTYGRRCVRTAPCSAPDRASS